MSFDLERLRASLLTEPLSEHFVQEEGAPDLPLTPAAVLFPIVLRNGGHTVLLTQRTAHLRDHAGQISFPGGRVETEDISPSHTALRETEEEIGLNRERIEIIGFCLNIEQAPAFVSRRWWHWLGHLSNCDQTHSRWRKCLRCRLPFCWIQPTTSVTRCTIVARCGPTLPCLTASILFGAPRRE